MGAPLVGAVVYSAIPTRSPSSRSRCLMVLLVRTAPARHALRRRAVLSSFMAIVAASLEQDDEAAVLLTAAATLFKFLQQPSRRFVLLSSKMRTLDGVLHGILLAPRATHRRWLDSRSWQKGINRVALWSFDNLYSDAVCWSHFRFHKSDLPSLLVHLQLDGTDAPNADRCWRCSQR